MFTYVIAVVLGLVIFRTIAWGVKMLAIPVPPEPDPEDVGEVDQTYKCSVCGMRLTVTHAQSEDIEAPRHCREDMDPVWEPEQAT
jgi:hypothetical protein